MHRFWVRLNHKLNHQVYLRVLPVVALSTLLVGVVGWGVFSASVSRGRTDGGHHQMSDSFHALENQLTKEAWILEARRLRDGGGPMAPAQAPENGAVAQILLREGQSPRLGDFHWDGSGPEGSHAFLVSWVDRNRKYLDGRYQAGSWAGVRAGDSPRPMDSVFGTTLLSFAVALDAGKAYLPVLVQESTQPGAINSLYLFPLKPLVSLKNPESWWCMMDGDGRVVLSRDGALQQGVNLAQQPHQSDHGVLNKVNGQDLLGALDSESSDQGRIGGGLVPWLALRSEMPPLGLTMIMVDQGENLKSTVVVFLLVILLTTVLALGGAMYGINRVMNNTSAQLNSLSRNMENLARGDYSGRIPRLREDELGNLVGYFNLMAVSLDEAHRQVKEKASHLQAALENMRQLDRAKDDFMVLISHEVRTPLTAIMGGVDFLKKSMERVSKEDREILDDLNVEEIAGIIQSSGERLSGFMTDAIQMTSLGSADARLKLEAEPVGELISRGLCGVAELAAKKEVAIHNELEGPSPWSLLCDAEVLTVAFEKILKNAITHNRAGGVVIIREAREASGHGSIAELIDRDLLRRLEEQNTFLDYVDDDLKWRLIEIFNTGEPIPADRRAALFGKFELVGRIENHQKGSGLSLPIAKAAVESHGGRILLGSGNQDGNSFFILLPTLVTQVSDEPVETPNSGQKQAHGFGSIPWDEDISQMGDAAGFKVELENLCSSILGDFDETGSGVNSSGRTHDQEKVAVVRSLK